MVKDFWTKSREKWQTIVVIVFLTTALAFSVSAFLPAQYVSEVSILVIQKQTINKVDAFSAAKSAEYLSEILSQVIYSQSFLEDVLTAPFENKVSFPADISQRELLWQKMVETKKINDTGIVDIKVYAPSKREAAAMAQSVAWALSVRGHKYHGGGDWVKIITIDGPATSEMPAKPNLWLNTLLGFILGLFGAGAAVYFLDDFQLIIFQKKTIRVKTKKGKKTEPFVFPGRKENSEAVFLQSGRLTGDLLKKALHYSPEEDYRPFIKKTAFSSIITPPVSSVQPKSEEIVESVRVIEPENEPVVPGKKAPAPENLPIFQEEFSEEKAIKNDGFIDIGELRQAFKKQNEDGGQ